MENNIYHQQVTFTNNFCSKPISLNLTSHTTIHHLVFSYRVCGYLQFSSLGFNMDPVSLICDIAYSLFACAAEHAPYILELRQNLAVLENK